jgi:DnaJ-class molecular chaperone
MSLEATKREPEDCKTCDGTGSTCGICDADEHTCTDCGGTGTIDSEPSCEPEDYLDGDEQSYRRDMIDSGRGRLLR